MHTFMTLQVGLRVVDAENTSLVSIHDAYYGHCYRVTLTKWNLACRIPRINGTVNEYSTSLRRSTGDNASLEDEAEEELEEELRYGVRSSQVILGAATQSSPGSSSSDRWTHLCYITRQVQCNKTKASPNLRSRPDTQTCTITSASNRA
jgi:hypothetical protein